MDHRTPSELSYGSILRQHGAPLVWAVSIGVIFSLAAFFIIHTWERRNVDKAFRLAAADRATEVKSAFETELAMLELVRSSLISDGRIEREEFREILEPFLSRIHDIQAVEWAPRVPDSRRAECEAAAERDGIKGFHITVRDRDGQMTVAPRRDEYFPVYFIGPRPGNNGVYGFDLASEPTRLESLRLARDTGRTVASGRIAFIQDQKSTGGFLVYLPVYEKGKPVASVADRRKNLMGFVLGVFRPSEMIESALAKLQPEGIDVGLYDSSESATRPIYFHASRTRDEPGRPAGVRSILDPNGVRYAVKLDVGGHPWTIVCAPTREFEAAHRTWWAGAMLIAGLLFTAMLTGYLVQSIHHTASLETKVRQQTADVRHTQEDVLCRLASAAQWRDADGATNVRRIGLLSESLAKAAGWIGDDLDAIRQAAPLHDIGKIGIPDAILRKPGRLTAEDSDALKNHTRIGAEILTGSSVPMLQMAREIALNHHERWDGKGYPRGLSGTETPESARIVAIVAAYDALVHGRGGRPPLSSEEALIAMQQGADRQFDPLLLADFFRQLPEMRRIVEHYPDGRHRGSPAPSPETAPPRDEPLPLFPAVVLQPPTAQDTLPVG